jgi:integral membrane protein
MKLYRLIAFLEGCSYLLLAVTMVLKYQYDMPKPNYVVGLAHGFLFILYIILTAYWFFKLKWSFKIGLGLTLAAFVPFGTFIAEKKFLKFL